jgi:LPXTG-motif cell wall-anchored protein/uncharacterized repeat protein (TIGR01451 family)
VWLPVTVDAATCAVGQNAASVSDGTAGDSDTSPAIDTVCLVLAKSAVDDDALAAAAVTSVVPGDAYYYQFAISNTGTGASGPVTVTETLPAGLTADWANATTSHVGGVTCDGVAATCDIGSIAAGVTQYVWLPVTVDAATCAVAQNAASVSDGDTGDSATSPAIDTVCLELAKSAVDDDTLAAAAVTSVVPGDTYYYQLAVENTGSGASNAVTLTETLPAGLSADWANATTSHAGGVTCDSVAATCDIGSISAGDTEYVWLPVTVDAATCAVAQNAASVSDGDTGDSATSPAIDTVCLELAKSAVDDDALAAAAVTSLVPGDTYYYQFAIENTGSGASSPVTVTETLPAGLTADWANATTTHAGGVTCDSVAATCDIGSISAGDTEHVWLPVTVDAATCAVAQNAASVSDGDTGDSATSPAIDTVCLVLAKSAVDDDALAAAAVTSVVPGDTYYYQFAIENTGSGASGPVTVTETLPAGLTADWASATTSHAGGVTCDSVNETCDVGSIAAGDTEYVWLPVTVAPGTCAVGQNAADIDDGDTGDSATSPAIDTVCLELAKSAVDDDSLAAAAITQLEPGDAYYYQFAIENTGTGTSSPVTVTETLPAGLTADWANATTSHAGGVTCDSVAETCDIGAVAAGATEYVWLPVTVDAATCDVALNAASISDGNTGDSATSPAIPTLCLVLNKTSSLPGVGTTDPYTYTITVTNTGTADAVGVTVSDDLDDDLVFQYVVVTGAAAPVCTTGAGNTVTCGFNVPVGATTVMSIGVVATAAACGSVDDQATSNMADPSSTVTVLIACPVLIPDIDLTKTPSVTSADLGDTVTYTYLVENVGQVALSSITLTDDRLGDITLPLTSLLPGEDVQVSVDHVITADEVDNGSVTNTATTTGLTPSASTVLATASATVTLPEQPDISIVKTADVTLAEPGDVVTYTYVVTNTGNVTLSDVSVLDDVIGTILGSAAGTSLAAGESMTLTETYTVTEDDLRNGQVTNIASTQGTSPTGTLTTDADKVRVGVERTVVLDTAGLTIAKRVVGDNDGEGYTFSVDCGSLTLKDGPRFTLPARGGEHEVRGVLPVGTQCRIIETDAGGADKTTVATGSGPARTSRSVIATVKADGTTVEFTNIFDTEGEQELPATGTNAIWQLIAGLAALALGGGLLRSRRRRPRGWLRA